MTQFDAAARPSTAVIIPVLDEEESLPLVLAAVPAELVDEVVVVDNGSTDRSAEVARAAGATVTYEPHKGYGAACLKGIDATSAHRILVFLDGDFSDYPEDMRDLLQPVIDGEADLVIGSRMLLSESRKALLPQARFGNQLATFLMRVLFGIRCSDLGPFRVIRRDALLSLGMQDRDFGWTVEMQLRAKLRGLRVQERPVRYRRRVGVSKITGTVTGTLRAGHKILKTIFWYRLRPPSLNPSEDVPGSRVDQPTSNEDQ
jgi:glycosyltransferase involved in cell wall biosynthesis